MPIVTIDLPTGRPTNEIRGISDAVHAAMVQCLGVPERDRFQIVNQHEPGDLQVDRQFLDINRGEQAVLVRITLAAGRSADTKTAFYRRLAELFATATGQPTEDLVIVLTENNREDWSFGR